MKGSSGKIWLLGLAFAIALAPAALAEGKSSPKSAKRGTSSSTQEVEPSPPLSLQVRLVNLQKHSNGGVASVELDALASVDLQEVTLTVTLPQEVTFADGSRVYTRTINLAAGTTFDLPKDLIVGKDGKYNISIEATGTTSKGKPVRRGLAYKLLVGAQEKLPPVKDGAIEYQGVADGGN
ncbi:MAG: hypothetical protein L0191_03495 [Acidobacteria bacterium]|nr:hypothetical protein [Acidobacteriota bacterium]MCI0568122.1 hypothetical protein [Acidobacteriota bacterium]